MLRIRISGIFVRYLCMVASDMASSQKRKTSLTLDRAALDAAKEFGINVSAVAEEALQRAVAEARREHWFKENSSQFKAQAKWHEENLHPLADILVEPGKSTWSS